jgi:hypothetical protein
MSKEKIEVDLYDYLCSLMINSSKESLLNYLYKVLKKRLSIYNLSDEEIHYIMINVLKDYINAYIIGKKIEEEKEGIYE